LDILGGLIDFAILGSAAYHMAWSLVGEADRSIAERLTQAKTSRKLNRGYVHAIYAWQKRAATLNKNIGYMPGTLHHYWHGKKVNRQYVNRWKLCFSITITR
jgi:hypothetical protein